MRKEQLDRLDGFENESEAFQIELTKYWTQYEAIMKLVGTGFSGNWMIRRWRLMKKGSVS